MKRKRKIQYLIQYKPDNGVCIFNIQKFECITFIEIYKSYYHEINIAHFYGSDLQKDYNLEDSIGISSLALLDKYLKSKERQDLVLNDLKFKTNDGTTISFNDDFYCTIVSEKNNFWDVKLRPLLIYLGSCDYLQHSLLENQEKYLAIEDGKIVKMFNGYEEYLNSDYECY